MRLEKCLDGKSQQRRGAAKMTPKFDLNLVLRFALVAFVTFAGGSSSADAIQLIILRPVVFLIAFILLWVPGADWREIKVLAGLLGIFSLTMVIQLVPLPPLIWHAIPGHGRFNTVLDAVGADANWRPLTVSVDGTVNAIVALTIPFTTLLAIAHVQPDKRPKVLLVILAVVALSMALGIAQVAGESTSLLYFYQLDGSDQLVGFFANRNHQAAMLAMSLPLIRVWVLLPKLDRFATGKSRPFIGGAAAAFVVMFILVLGSRAGLALGGIGLIGAFLVKPDLAAIRLWSWKRWIIAGAAVCGLAAMFAIVSFADRSASVERIASMQTFSREGRVEIMPVLLRIVADVWPFGTGYGSFVPVFKSYEPDTMLSPYYWNNAHNDPLEVLITGGLPGALAIIAFLYWWMRASYRAFASGNAFRSHDIAARGAVLATLILLLASLVDYPLRTPLLGAVFIALCCLMDPSGRRTNICR